MMMPDLEDPYFKFHSDSSRFRLIAVFGPRKHVGSGRNLRICFHSHVGRAWTLSVPARPHGASLAYEKSSMRSL